jgi:hypothetical protein
MLRTEKKKEKKEKRKKKNGRQKLFPGMFSLDLFRACGLLFFRTGSSGETVPLFLMVETSRLYKLESN